eukprot:4837877-Lingulodinium_polyedra.AAC.1
MLYSQRYAHPPQPAPPSMLTPQSAVAARPPPSTHGSHVRWLEAGLRRRRRPGAVQGAVGRARQSW